MLDLFLFSRGLSFILLFSIFLRYFQAGLQSVFRILQHKHVIARFGLCLRVCVNIVTQRAQASAKTLLRRDYLFHAFMEIFGLIFIQSAAFILVQIVIDLVNQRREIFKQIMNSWSASLRLLGIATRLVNAVQPGLSKLNVKLEALLRLQGHLPQLVGFRVRQRVMLARERQSRGHHQNNQGKFFCRAHRIFLFFGANITLSRSWRKSASFFSTSCTEGRSTAASVRRMFSRRRCASRRWISTCFSFFLELTAASWARVALARMSCTVFWPLAESPAVNC